MEIESAARKKLLTIAALTGYVGTKVFRHRMLEDVEGTGGSAVVVRRDGEWTRPQMVNTQEYPILVIECWADPDRDPKGGIARGNAEDKAWALHRVIDPVLHGIRGQLWGASEDNVGLLIIGCDRWSAGSVIVAPPKEGRQSVFVQSKYAVQTVHGT